MKISFWYLEQLLCLTFHFFVFLKLWIEIQKKSFIPYDANSSSKKKIIIIITKSPPPQEIALRIDPLMNGFDSECVLPPAVGAKRKHRKRENPPRPRPPEVAQEIRKMPSLVVVIRVLLNLQTFPWGSFCLISWLGGRKKNLPLWMWFFRSTFARVVLFTSLR